MTPDPLKLREPVTPDPPKLRDRLALRLGSTEFIFGWGTAAELPGLASAKGERVLVATSAGTRARTSVVADLESTLSGRVEVFAQIEPNPDLDQVDRASRAAQDADLVVGIGGGSVMDAAKAIAVVASSGRDAAGWLEAGRVPDDAPRKQLVLVPTTAGTGSELSHGAILSNPIRDFKGGLRGARLAPDVALVDPALCVSAPRELTARTAFDIACHAIESFVSRRSNPSARVLALEALSRVARSAPRALAAPNDREARSDLSYASSLMGLNLASVGTCLPHRLQYAFGGIDRGLSHAQGLAWIYPVWLRHLYDHATDSLRALLPTLGLAAPQNAGQASESMRSWLEGLGLETRPHRHARFEEGTLAALVQGPLDVDPIPNPSDHVLPILREILA